MSPLSVKKDFIKGEALRLLRTNSIKERFESNKWDFKFRLLERSYPVDVANRFQATIKFTREMSSERAVLLWRLPFVRTGRPDWSFRKWNARVLRTERTASRLSTLRGTLEVCDLISDGSSLGLPGPSNNYLLSLFKGRPTKCRGFLGAEKLVSSPNIEDAIRKWLLRP